MSPLYHILYTIKARIAHSSPYLIRIHTLPSTNTLPLPQCSYSGTALIVPIILPGYSFSSSGLIIDTVPPGPEQTQSPMCFLNSSLLSYG